MIKIPFLLIFGMFYIQKQILIFISGFCFGYLYFAFLVKTDFYSSFSEIDNSIKEINNSVYFNNDN